MDVSLFAVVLRERESGIAPVSQIIWLPHFIAYPVHNILVYSAQVCKLCLEYVASHKVTLHPPRVNRAEPSR